MRKILIALAVMAALPAFAHQLNVFASVDGTDVVVEAKFSSGKVPQVGEVRVFDAADVLLVTLPLTGEETLRFPLDPVAAQQGLRIEVKTGEGHEDYWILTPDDIAAGQTN